MPRVRYKLPIEVNLTQEQLDALESVGTVVQKVREVGLWDALKDAGKKAAVASAKMSEARRRRTR